MSANTSYKYLATANECAPGSGSNYAESNTGFVTTYNYAETGSQPSWSALPSVTNISANQADVNWSCTDESGLNIVIYITYQKFLTGYSPTYVGRIDYSDVPSGSNITKTVTGLESNYNYDFNTHCYDQAGHGTDRQVTLSR